MRRRVLIVDDHTGYRALARELLESEGLEVVGEANDGDSAVAATLELRPDLVLLDVHLPGLDGFEVAERLAGLRDAPAVVLISSRRMDELADRLGTASAAGFIAKHELSAAAITSLVG